MPAGGLTAKVSSDLLSQIIPVSLAKPKFFSPTKFGYVAGVNRTSRLGVTPEFDVAQIDALYDTEAYAKRIRDRMISLVVQEGWGIVSRNDAAREYIKQRVRMMEISMGKGTGANIYPFSRLIDEISQDLITYHNVVLIKSRLRNDVKVSLPSTSIFKRLAGVNASGPVTGYWPVHLDFMTPTVDGNGRLISWTYEVPGAPPVTFSANDVIHFALTPTRGEIFGKPPALNALDDVKALREFEEDTLQVMARHITPLILMKIGLPQPGLYGRLDEVATLREEIANMPLQGWFACTERLSAESVLQTSGITDQFNFLKYFRNRTLSGLLGDPFIVGDISDMNNSVADQARLETYVWIKFYQRAVATVIADFIFNEWLREDNWNIMNTDVIVNFQFKEIDFDNKIKHENHVIQKFAGNVATLDEVRTDMGIDPLQDSEQKGLFSNLIKIPEIKAAHPPGATGAGAPKTKTNKTTANRDRPTNQYKTKGSPQKGRK